MDILWAGPSDIDLNRAMADWASRIIWPDRHIDFTPCTCMGVVSQRQLLAVMVWNNWEAEGGIMELSGAAVSKRWMTRPVINAMYAYPFEQVGCQMVVARVSERNKPVLRILKSKGYDRVTIPRLRGRDEAEVICTMTHEQWLGSKFYDGGER